MNTTTIRPTRLNLFREAFAGVEALTMPAALLKAKEQNTTETKPFPVIVLPGFGANDLSTAPLRYFLSRNGYQTEGWGLGLNAGGRGLISDLSELDARWNVDNDRTNAEDGEAPALIDRFIDHALDRAEFFGTKISLIGWSLGGYVARETARELPDVVASVVTMGAPVNGGPKHTSVAPLFRARNIDLDWIESEIEKRNSNPITQPITAIYSERDGIVSNYAAYDTVSPNIRHIEVGSSHFGFGINPKIWDIVLESLELMHEGVS